MVVNNEIFKIYNEIDSKRNKLSLDSSLSNEEVEEQINVFVKNIKDNYKRKHKEYFESDIYKQELTDLKKYFNGLKQGIRDKSSKYDVFYKLIAVYSSNKPDALKLLQIKQIINFNDFSSLLGPFCITCINNGIIRKVYEIYQFVYKYKKDITILMVDNEEFKKDVADFYSLIKSNVDKVQINKAKSNFVEKYKYYFDSSEYEKKVEWLTLFLDPYGRKIVNNLNKVPLLIDIYNSNICDYEKINQMSRLISPIKLIKLLLPYAVTFYDNDFIKKAMDVYFFVKEHENEFELVKKDALYLEELEIDKKKLLPIKDYASSVLSYYISNNDCLSLYDYIKQLDINIVFFNDCVNACAIFDYELFQKFLEVKKQKETIVNENNVKIMKDLVDGIKTDYLSDGTLLTVLEFMKRLPLKNEITCLPDDFVNYFCSYLKQFLTEEEVSLISSYMIKNRINNLSIKEINTESEFSYHSINDIVVTEEIHDYLIKYMQYYNYPLIRGIYYVLLKKYLNGELEIVKEIKEHKIKVKAILAP